MRSVVLAVLAIIAAAASGPALAAGTSPLGLPPVPVPAANPQTPEKIALEAYITWECRGARLQPGKH